MLSKIKDFAIEWLPVMLAWAICGIVLWVWMGHMRDNGVSPFDTRLLFALVMIGMTSVFLVCLQFILITARIVLNAYSRR